MLDTGPLVGHDISMRLFCLLCLFLLSGVSAQTVTRLHFYGEADPNLVERQIRSLVPEKPRVSMNPEARQVIVVAEPAVQDKVAGMVEQLAKVPLELSFRIRLNREVEEVTVESGVLFSVPVSREPPQTIVQLARARLNAGKQKEPVVASGLQFHPVLLREEPVVVRIRITPVVVFGSFQPYEVVEFSEYQQDLLMDTGKFLNLSEHLASHDFYRNFLRTAADPSEKPKPVGLLLSMEAGPAEVPQ